MLYNIFSFVRKYCWHTFCTFVYYCRVIFIPSNNAPLHHSIPNFSYSTCGHTFHHKPCISPEVTFIYISMYTNICSNRWRCRKQTYKLESSTSTARCPIQASFVANARDLCIGTTKTGRLGNQLFQFASGYGIARLLNRTFAVGMTDLILKLFRITDVVLTDRDSQIKKWPRVHEKKCCAYRRNFVATRRPEERKH